MILASYWHHFFIILGPQNSDSPWGKLNFFPIDFHIFDVYTCSTLQHYCRRERCEALSALSLVRALFHYKTITDIKNACRYRVLVEGKCRRLVLQKITYLKISAHIFSEKSNPAEAFPTIARALAKYKYIFKVRNEMPTMHVLI